QSGLTENNTDIRNNFISKQNRRIRRTRFFRTHTTAIGITAVSFVFIIAIVFSLGKRNHEKITTQGMSALEVVETLYEGINTINAEQIERLGTKAAIGTFSKTVTSVYATQKMRQAYERIPPFFTPQQWLHTANPIGNIVFGISNLTISSIQEPDTQKQISDADKTIYTAEIGDSAVYKATYYHLSCTGDYHYEVNHRIEILSLHYSATKYWQIISTHTESDKIIEIDSKQFQKDLKEAFEQATPKTRGFEIAERLQKTYDWIPNSKSVTAAKKEILLWVEPEAH
ncbi:MAG TPA: hypothetical protein VFC68_05070, partial [Treponemataceae bacterium]|nr:hypothetical protein [Treponemataceae bacterium]